MKKRKIQGLLAAVLVLAMCISIMPMETVKAEEDPQSTNDILESDGTDTEPDDDVDVDDPDGSGNVQDDDQDDPKDKNNKDDILNDVNGNNLSDTEKDLEPQNTDDEETTSDLAEGQSGTDDLDAAYIQENDLANSWRFQDGELIPPTSLWRSRPYTTWPNDPAATAFGVDVSYHNGTIDWEKAKKAGVEYAIIRCGYGNNLEKQDDAQWLRNVSECERLGIPYGVYIYSYAMSTSDAASEADHVLRLLKGHNPSYPVYYDLENEGAPYDQTSLGKTKLGDIAETFAKKIEAAGYQVGIYANKNWFENYLTDSRFDQWERWVAQYNSECTYQGEYRMWQCSSSGKVDGISGNVDLNLDYSVDTDTPGATITEGTYIIQNCSNTGMVLDVKGGSETNGGNIQLYKSNNSSAQRYEIISVGNGYYKIMTERTGRAIDVRGGSGAAGTNVQQYEWNSKAVDAQLWKFVDAGNGSYYLQSKLGTVMDIAGSTGSSGMNVQMNRKDGTSAQKWKLVKSENRPFADGIYTFRATSSNNLVVDVSNGSTADKTKMWIWNFNSTPAQRFKLQYVASEGYYKVLSEKTGKALAYDASNTGNKAAVWQMPSKDNADEQLWQFIKSRDGDYYIKSKTGKVLDITGGTFTKKTYVQTYTMKDVAAQHWTIRAESDYQAATIADGTYSFRTALGGNYMLEIAGGGWSNGTNIQIYKSNGTASQKFKVQAVGDGYYKITSTKTGKSLDVASGKMSSGANVQQYTWNNSTAQLWKFIDAGDGTYYIQSKLGTMLDVEMGVAASKTNVQAYTMNKTASQKWVLVKQ